jgi:hypothetical protein
MEAALTFHKLLLVAFMVIYILMAISVQGCTVEYHCASEAVTTY